MRSVFLLFLLFPACFAANNFGSAEIDMDKKWVITCYEDNCAVEFEGILAVNNSNQRVVSIETEPLMNLTSDESGEIHALYNGTVPEGRFELAAVINVEVDYNTEVKEDPPLAFEYVVPAGLTEWNEDIANKARDLAVYDSTLKTLRNTVEWVHDNIEYDVSYFGQKRDAKTVFFEKRGVCVEYSHLLISMLNSLGIRTRYVNGYVLSEEWQPHAWVEAYVDGYGWLPLDPTFNQMGILDSSHVMVSYGSDQETDFDRLVSASSSAMFERLPTELTVLSEEKDPKGLSVSVGFENGSYTAVAEIRNNRDDYVFGLYSFNPPEGYGNATEKVLLLSPYETAVKRHQLDSSRFSEGYSYSIPLKAAINDAETTKTVVVTKRRAATGAGYCPFALLVAALTLLAVIKFTDK